MGKNVDYVTVDVDSSTTDEYGYGGEDECNDDFPSMFVKLFTHINIKVAIFIFILGLFLFSDIFTRSVLKIFNGSVNQLGTPTSHGTIIQLSFLVLGYILIDLLVQGKYI
jgi:hypothetical protein